MTRLLVTKAFTLLVVFISAYSVVLAQQTGTQSDFQATVKIGTYRDLGFWRKLKLGTAPYVNRRLLDTAAVGYRYNLDNLIERVDCEQQESNEIYGALVEGKVMFANGGQDGEFQVISPDDPRLREHIDTCEHFRAWADTQQQEITNAAFISIYSEFAEVPGTPVVAWVAEPWTRQAGQ